MQNKILLTLLTSVPLLVSCKADQHKADDPFVPEDIGSSIPVNTPDPDKETRQTSEDGEASFALANPTPTQLKTYGRFAPSFAWPVIPIHVVLMPNGKVLSFGTDQNGNQGGQYNYSVWDPSLGTGPNSMQLLPNTQNTDIFCSATSILPATGDVLIAGGDTRNPANFGIKDTLVYNMNAQNLTRTSYMNLARWYPTLMTLASGETMVYGGRDAGGAPIVPPEIYQNNGTWRTVMGASNGNIINNDEAKWFYPRTWVAPDGRVFGTTGNVMFYLDLNGNGSAQVAGFVPNKTRSNTSTAVMYQPGKILQLGGSFDGNTQVRASNQAILININSGTPQVTNLPNASFARHWGSATVLPNGEVLITGGSAFENQMNETAYTAEMFDPATNTFRQLADANFARLYHSISLLMPDGTVLTGGGGAPGPQLNKNAEIYYPPYFFDNAGQMLPRLTIGALSGTQAYGQTISFPVTGTGTPTRVTFVRGGSVTHSWDMGQRFMDLQFTNDNGVISATLPASPNVAPPGPYMLFVVSDNGTPSVAKIVSLKGTGDTGPAQPSTPPQGLNVDTPYQFVARHSNKCASIENNSAGNNANLKQFPCDGRSGQKFKLQNPPSGPGFYLVNTTNNKCVTVLPGDAENGRPVQQLDCTGTPNQIVNLVASANGSFTVRFTHDGKCMDVSGISAADNQQIHQWECVNGVNQDWLVQIPAGTPNPPVTPPPTTPPTTPPAGLTVGNTYQLAARHSNKCASVEGNSAANNANLKQFPCDGRTGQKFTLQNAPAGGFYLRNPTSDKCITVNPNNANNGNPVQQTDCTGATNQLLNFVPSANGSFQVRFQTSAKCMDVSEVSAADNQQIHQWECLNGVNQDWLFQTPPGTNPPTPPVTPPTTPPPAGITVGTTYQLAARHSNKCASVEGNSAAPNANVKQISCDGRSGQKFKVENATDGFYLRNPNSDKCITVNPDNANNGNFVQQTDCTGAANQILTFVASTNGSFQIRFKTSAKCMDVSEISAAENQQIHQWACEGGANADWFFQTPATGPVVTPLPGGLIANTPYSLVVRHSNKCAHLDNLSGANNTNIYQKSCDNSANQKFKIVQATNGDYSLVNVTTGKCVQVENSSLENGANISSTTCTNIASQSLKIITGSVSPFFSLRFTHSNKCFDVSGPTVNEGQNIHQWECGAVAGSNQEWKFQP